jgi:hypothetical protein
MMLLEETASPTFPNYAKNVMSKLFWWCCWMIFCRKQSDTVLRFWYSHHIMLLSTPTIPSMSPTWAIIDSWCLYTVKHPAAVTDAHVWTIRYPTVCVGRCGFACLNFSFSGTILIWQVHICYRYTLEISNFILKWELEYFCIKTLLRDASPSYSCRPNMSTDSYEYRSNGSANSSRKHEQNCALFCNSKCNYLKLPTDGVSTLSWWWGLSAPEILRAMPAVA